MKHCQSLSLFKPSWMQENTAEEVLAVALQLLDEYERSESEWVEDVWTKIDAAIDTSEHTPPVDGETFVNSILERFQQAKQS
jgi:antitoxin ParD1/3/4